MNAETVSDRLLTTAEVAEYLGLPTSTLYAWRYRRVGPPAIRVGKHLRYRRQSLDAWVSAQAYMS